MKTLLLNVFCWEEGEEHWEDWSAMVSFVLCAGFCLATDSCGLCIMCHCCDKIPEKSTLRKERFILPRGLIVGFIMGAWQPDHEIAAHIPSVLGKLRWMLVLSLHLPYQSKTPSHGVMPSTFRVHCPMSVNLIWKLPQTCQEICLIGDSRSC